jgi:hypothetical protein
MSGIFITRGMAISIPKFTLTMGDDGQISSDVKINVRFDVCPTWIQLAQRHLAVALEARGLRETVWRGTDENEKALALEREFEASMQAIMSGAIAIDAFYSILQQHVQIPESLIAGWRTGRTPRYTQVSEVIRRAFSLKPKGTAALRSTLKEVYRIRDLAVHPSGKIEAPVLHPELDLGVEWRFAYFRASNAEQVVNAVTWMLWDLAHNGKAKEPKIIEYAETLKARLQQCYPDGHPSAATAKPPP